MGWLYYIYNFFVFCWEGGKLVVRYRVELAPALLPVDLSGTRKLLERCGENPTTRYSAPT